jgi:hypothetical protein
MRRSLGPPPDGRRVSLSEPVPHARRRWKGLRRSCAGRRRRRAAAARGRIAVLVVPNPLHTELKPDAVVDAYSQKPTSYRITDAPGGGGRWPGFTAGGGLPPVVETSAGITWPRLHGGTAAPTRGAPISRVHGERCCARRGRIFIRRGPRQTECKRGMSRALRTARP